MNSRDRRDAWYAGIHLAGSVTGLFVARAWAYEVLPPYLSAALTAPHELVRRAAIGTASAIAVTLIVWFLAAKVGMALRRAIMDTHQQTCAVCGRTLSPREAGYCVQHRRKFGGKMLCTRHQTTEMAQ